MHGCYEEFDIECHHAENVGHNGEANNLAQDSDRELKLFEVNFAVSCLL